VTTTDRQPPHHRNLTCVKQYRCRLPECVARIQAYERRRYRQKGYGTWQPLVDAEPARQHIAALRAAGHSVTTIQKKARVSSATLARILYDGVNQRAERIRPDVAQRILAIPVQAAPVTPHTIVDGTGTRRRLQALIAMGWTCRALAPHLGIHARQVERLVWSERILASTAAQVAERYRTLQIWHPGNHGVPSRSQNLARNLAAREGWHGPLAWDDIDDPNCQPETGGKTDTVRRPKAVVDPARVARLTAIGKTAEQIAAELGCHKRSVTRARRRAEMGEAA
jgi:DNA invertase Pin-like site-specific DNA recombinase